MKLLALGLIFRVFSDAGIALRGRGAKRTCRCPFHDDKSASAFVSADNIFYCSRCTQGRGWSAKYVCEKLGLDWRGYATDLVGIYRSHPPLCHEAGERFTASDACRLWNQAHTRARDDNAAHHDLEAYGYLDRRGLLEAHELGLFGVLAPEMAVHRAVACWAPDSYRIVAPLYDFDGVITNVQSRAIKPRKRRTLVPLRSGILGTVFADARALALLRGESPAADTVIYGEGLTDMLALGIASPVPVFTMPGSGNATSSVGYWASGLRALLALDCDEDGNSKVDATTQALRHHGAVHVKRVTWPTGCKDACDVVARSGIKGLHEFLLHEISEVNT